MCYSTMLMLTFRPRIHRGEFAFLSAHSSCIYHQFLRIRLNLMSHFIRAITSVRRWVLSVSFQLLHDRLKADLFKCMRKSNYLPLLKTRKSNIIFLPAADDAFLGRYLIHGMKSL